MRGTKAGSTVFTETTRDRPMTQNFFGSEANSRRGSRKSNFKSKTYRVNNSMSVNDFIESGQKYQTSIRKPKFGLKGY